MNCQENNNSIYYYELKLLTPDKIMYNSYDSKCVYKILKGNKDLLSTFIDNI